MSDEIGPEDMVITPAIMLEGCGAGGAGGAGGRGSGATELGRRLLVAARGGDTQLVLQLMGKGAPFTTDWLGTSALHVAARGAHAHTCAVLLRAGVSRDCRTKVDRTPLHLAAHAGHEEVARLLLDHRALVDSRDMLRMTPLHWAAARGHAGVAALLLRRGADPRARSKFHKTPRDLALQHGDARVLRLVDDALADADADARRRRRLDEQSISDTETDSAQRNLEKIQNAGVAEASESAPPPDTHHQSGSERGEAEAGAAVLRRHGITLLPDDEGSTVLTALQSGRSVVLSDAGKIMLKESGESSPAPAPSASAGVAGVSGGAGGGGVVVRATPVRSVPRAGVKIFTLTNHARNAPHHNKIIGTGVKFLQLSPDAKVIPMKAKSKAAARPAPAPASASAAASAALVDAGEPAGRSIVNLVKRKPLDLNKLIHKTDNGTESQSAGVAGVATGAGDAAGGVLFVPEEFLTNGSPKYLRAQLLAAHRTIAALDAQLAQCRARLAAAPPRTHSDT